MQSNSFTKQLKDSFNQSTIHQIARKQRFFQRERKITPYNLLMALISAFASEELASLADLQRHYNLLNEEPVAYKPFHNQLAKKSFSNFMSEVAHYLFHQLAGKYIERDSTGTFSEFDKVIIQDGTSFALHDGLSDVFPGRFSSVSPAAVELHVAWDCQNNTFESLSLTKDTASERAYLPEASSLSGSLLLADAGYFSRDYIHQLQQAKAHFIMKVDSKINPYIEQCFTPTRYNKKLTGEPLKSSFDFLSKEHPNDLDVHWQSLDGHWFVSRLIVSWNTKVKCFQYLVTNLPRHRYTCQRVIGAYRFRWQIELLFKEWKSYSNLKKFNTQKAHIAEGLIWASLIAALLKRLLAVKTQQLYQVIISPIKVANCSKVLLPELFLYLIKNSTTQINNVLDRLFRFLKTNARRAHPKRDKVYGWDDIGFKPFYGEA